MIINKNTILNICSSIATFLFLAVSLILPSGYSIGALMLVLAGFYSFFKFRRQDLNLTSSDMWIVAALLLFSLTWFLEVVMHDPGIRELDKPLRFVFAIIALIFLIRFPPRAIFFWVGALVGSVLTGLWACWQRLVLGFERAEGFTNAIQFGNISLLLGVMCLAGLGWASQQKKPALWQLLLVIGFDFGFLGSVFTGSRGGWLAMPVILFCIGWVYYQLFSWRFKALLLGNWILLVLFALFSPYAGGQERLLIAFHELDAYGQGFTEQTSIGIRLELWKTAIILIPEHPWFGWGTTDYMLRKQFLIDNRIIHPVLHYFDHVHNELLNTQLKRGFFGVLGLLALYLIPLWIFFKQLLNNPNLETRSLATAGILLSLCYGVFGLTQVFFAHNSGVMIYAFMVVIIWSMIRFNNKKI